MVVAPSEARPAAAASRQAARGDAEALEREARLLEHHREGHAHRERRPAAHRRERFRRRITHAAARVGRRRAADAQLDRARGGRCGMRGWSGERTGCSRRVASYAKASAAPGELRTFSASVSASAGILATSRSSGRVDEGDERDVAPLAPLGVGLDGVLVREEGRERVPSPARSPPRGGPCTAREQLARRGRQHGEELLKRPKRAGGRPRRGAGAGRDAQDGGNVGEQGRVVVREVPAP